MNNKKRKLDLMIAKRFFDYPVCEDDTHDDSDGWCRKCQKHKPEYYSTYIDTAWKIVKKLAERGCTTSIEYKGSDREYKFTAEVTISKNISAIGHGVGNVAEAICIAALSITE